MATKPLPNYALQDTIFTGRQQIPVLAIVGLSVCLYVRLSVTRCMNERPWIYVELYIR